MQYEGEAHQPEGAELAHYQEVYFARWPDGPSRTGPASRISWFGRSGSAIATLIRIRPSLRSSPSSQVVRLQDISRKTAQLWFIKTKRLPVLMQEASSFDSSGLPWCGLRPL